MDVKEFKTEAYDSMQLEMIADTKSTTSFTLSELPITSGLTLKNNDDEIDSRSFSLVPEKNLDQLILHTWTDFSFESFKKFEEIENRKQSQFNLKLSPKINQESDTQAVADEELHSLFEEAFDDVETFCRGSNDSRNCGLGIKFIRKNKRQISGAQLTNLIEDKSAIACEPQKYAFVEFVPDHNISDVKLTKRQAASKAVEAIQHMEEENHYGNFEEYAVDSETFSEDDNDNEYKISLPGFKRITKVSKFDPAKLGFEEITQMTRASNKLITDSEFDEAVRTLKDLPKMPDFILNSNQKKPKFLKRYICKICNVTFNTSLVVHMFQHHNYPAPYTCNQATCNYKTEHKSAMKFHLWDIHGVRCGVDSLYRCSKCPVNASKIFINPKKMKNHSETHLPRSKNFLCTKCNSKFHSQYRLSIHKKQVHSKLSWSCDRCSSIFTTESRLRRHISNSHDAVRNWKCAYCDHAAVQRNNCIIHIRGKHKGKQEVVIDLNLPNAFRF